MPKQPTDIAFSPDQAEPLLSDWLGADVRCSDADRLAGGMLSSVLRLSFDRKPFSAVVKLNLDDDATVGEIRSRLDYLSQHTDLPSPKAYASGRTSGDVSYAYLLMETVPGITLEAAQLRPDDKKQVDHEIAEALLGLHSHTRSTYGRVDEEPGVSSWADVMVERLADLRGDMVGVVTAAALEDIDHAIEAAATVMDVESTPTLVHGDVWAANIMVIEGDDGWHLSGFLDPGLHFADVEHELSYLQVFDTVGQTFFDTYCAHTPFRPGYEVRRLFYWLNTWMIHVWLFGDRQYIDGATSVAAEIRRTV